MSILKSQRKDEKTKTVLFCQNDRFNEKKIKNSVVVFGKITCVWENS